MGEFSMIQKGVLTQTPPFWITKTHFWMIGNSPISEISH
jgi:hypothetical protein